MLLAFRVVRVVDVSCGVCCWRFVWFVLLTFRVVCVVAVSGGLCFDVSCVLCC